MLHDLITCEPDVLCAQHSAPFRTASCGAVWGLCSSGPPPMGSRQGSLPPPPYGQRGCARYGVCARSGRYGVCARPREDRAPTLARGGLWSSRAGSNFIGSNFIQFYRPPASPILSAPGGMGCSRDDISPGLAARLHKRGLGEALYMGGADSGCQRIPSGNVVCFREHDRLRMRIS